MDNDANGGKDVPGSEESYAVEFKKEAVRLVEGSHSLSAVAKQLGISSSTDRSWPSVYVQEEIDARGLLLDPDLTRMVPRFTGKRCQ